METPGSARVAAASSRAWFSASISDFLQTQPDAIVGRLATNSDFTLLLTQKDAWLAQIGFLQAHLVGLSGSLFLEFNIPRMGRRIDTVLLIGPVVFVIEFKVGESAFDRAAVDQVWDYALDLKNFTKPAILSRLFQFSLPLEQRNRGRLIFAQTTTRCIAQFWCTPPVFAKRSM